MPSNDSDYALNDLDILPTILNGTPFRIRPDGEKTIILRKGRPLPLLTITTGDEGNMRNNNITFQTSWYTTHNWLCGSRTYNKLFCWPCTLMRPDTSSWCSSGNDDFKRLPSLAFKHLSCKTHLKAIAEYDAMVMSLGLQPEFTTGSSSLDYRDDDDSSIQNQDGSSDPPFFTKARNVKSNIYTQKDVDRNSPSNYLVSENDGEHKPKLRTKITFRKWQDLNKDFYPVGQSQIFEDHKLYKWKRRVAKQELKNAILQGERLKIEIELLKAKAEYYKSLKSDLADIDNKSSIT